MHNFSPLNVLFRDLVPAMAADWQDLVLVVDVDLDFGIVALAVPRISATLCHANASPLSLN